MTITTVVTRAEPVGSMWHDPEPLPEWRAGGRYATLGDLNDAVFFGRYATDHRVRPALAVEVEALPPALLGMARYLPVVARVGRGGTITLVLLRDASALRDVVGEGTDAALARHAHAIVAMQELG